MDTKVEATLALKGTFCSSDRFPRLAGSRGGCLEFSVETSVGDAHRIAARLVERKGEGARNNAR